MFARLILSILAPFLSAGGAVAASDEPLCAGCDMAEETSNLRIEIRTQLDFSQATVGNSGGQIRLDPKSGDRTVAGSVVNLGGMAFAGSVLVQGTPGRNIRIDLPSTITMRNARGGSLVVRNLRTNLSAAPRLDSFGKLEFAFGGDLEIGGDAFGDYRGRIPITAEYE
jgi:Domain of unknown function (DUF4402)